MLAGNLDELDALRCVFLQSNYSEGCTLVSPTLLKVERSGALVEVPPQTLALQSGWVLYMDVLSHVLVWSGREVAGPEFEGYRLAARAKAVETVRGRYPSTQVRVFAEGSSEARYVVSRLAPAHKDFPDEQAGLHVWLSSVGVEDMVWEGFGCDVC